MLVVIHHLHFVGSHQVAVPANQHGLQIVHRSIRVFGSFLSQHGEKRVKRAFALCLFKRHQFHGFREVVRAGASGQLLQHNRGAHGSGSGTRLLRVRTGRNFPGIQFRVCIVERVVPRKPVNGSAPRFQIFEVGVQLRVKQHDFIGVQVVLDGRERRNGGGRR